MMSKVHSIGIVLLRVWDLSLQFINFAKMLYDDSTINLDMAILTIHFECEPKYQIHDIDLKDIDQ